MFPGINPRKMQHVMKRMGIQQDEIPAKEVIIRGEEKDIVITNLSVVKVNMMGQETFQISGDISERELSSAPDVTSDDVKTVMDQANVSEDEAKKALEGHNGDIAEAILSLKK